VQKNNDNPVYYVQYAHARICSVLLKEIDGEGNELAALMALGESEDKARLMLIEKSAAKVADADLSHLDSPAAQALMLLLAKYPAMLADAARDFAPHDVTFYLRELAACYHSYYDAERILVDDEAVKRARLALVAATRQVLHNGLAVLGVSAPQKM
jgi:arginyl-tRNA synthetase